MSAAPASHSAGAAWSVDSIPYDTLDRARVRDDTVLFFMVSSASLVEFASGVYTRKLTEFFHDDDEVVGWLTQSWEREELQHREALKRYVQAAWPDLDWESACEGFIAELLPCYSVDRLAPTRALEMVGRCVPLAQERIRGSSQRQPQASEAPLSLYDGDQDAAEAARA
jgi:hypothetical protein